LKDLETLLKKYIKENDVGRGEEGVYLKNISEQVCQGLPKLLNGMQKDIKNDIKSKMCQTKQVKDEAAIVIIDDEPRQSAPGLEPISSDEESQ